MTKTISITLDTELIKYVDDQAELNSRSRSSMIAYLIKTFEDKDKEAVANSKRVLNFGADPVNGNKLY